MRIKIEFTTGQAKRFLERQIKPVFFVVGTALIAAWALAGWEAFTRWTGWEYNNESGWIIVWVVVSAAWGGFFLYLDDEGKP